MVLIHHLRPKVIEIVRKLIVEDEKLRDFMAIYNAEIEKSLDEKTAGDSTVKSYVTHVNKQATVTRGEGTFLSLEFGSHSITLMLMTMTKSNYQLQIQPIEIPERLKFGKSEKLLDFIAMSLSKFLQDFRVRGRRIPMGIVVGFPIEEISLQNCKFLECTTGFNCRDLVDKNIFTKFNDSFRKYPNLKNVYIIGILNQITSLLLAASFEEPEVNIALDIGEETSMCYMEKVSRVKKYEPKSYAEKFMCIRLNTDGFGEDGCLDEFKTDFDIQLDEESANPGKLTFEKMTSAMYIGEIARLALVRCITSKAILNGQLTEEILKKNSFNCEHMLRIEADFEDSHINCIEVLNEFGFNAVTDEDCIQVQFVCRCVSRRVANLMAAQLAVLVERINKPFLSIVLNGDFLENYPNFKWYLIQKLEKLKKGKYSLQLLTVRPTGAVRGGGILAMIFRDVIIGYEKLRRLPGFPVNRCHFRGTGRCLNPDCGAKHPCGMSKINPMQNPIRATARDIESNCFDQKHCSRKNDCFGYDQLSASGF